MPAKEYRIKKEPSKYILVSREFISSCRDLEMIGIYVYLCSFSENGGVNNENIMQHFNLSESKVKEILNKLKNENLITWTE